LIRSCLRLFAASLLLAATSISSAVPPRFPLSNEITWPATMKTPPSTGMWMGKFYVALEKTTLDDVRSATKLGTILHRGDASESTYWLCFTNLKDKNAERIWISSNSEMGGPDHAVTSIIAELAQTNFATAECPALPARLKPLSVGYGIWIGSAMTHIQKALGKPSFTKQDWNFYNHASKVPGNCKPDGFDTLNLLSLQQTKGRLTTLFLDQVTSC
jgi:hypothetical protein